MSTLDSARCLAEREFHIYIYIYIYIYVHIRTSKSTSIPAPSLSCSLLQSILTMPYLNNYKAPVVEIPRDCHLHTPEADYDHNYVFEVQCLQSDRVELRPFIVRPTSPLFIDSRTRQPIYCYIIKQRSGTRLVTDDSRQSTLNCSMMGYWPGLKLGNGSRCRNSLS